MNDDIRVSSVSLGCWPIAGITSIGVTREDSLATIAAAFDAGITHFDTAHAYGYEGESEQMVGEVLRQHQHEVTIATKVGLVWGEPNGEKRRVQKRDGRPETLRRQCEESLCRLGLDVVDVLYLHAPDPGLAIEAQAETLKSLRIEGKARAIGVSNFKSRSEYEQFAEICSIAFDQQPYNMLQRDIETEILPWNRSQVIQTAVYWPLMKGLLAGKITREYQFAAHDSRPTYPVFQGQRWDRAHDVLDELRVIAAGRSLTVAQLVVAWTAAQPGISTVLCGAKRPEQIQETAIAMSVSLDDGEIDAVDRACEQYFAIDQV